MKIIKQWTQWDKMYECACMSEALVVSNCYHENELDCIDIAFFNHGFGNRKLRWIDRIRFCWKVITTGTPYTDMLTLNISVVKKLADDLQKTIKGKLQ